MAIEALWGMGSEYAGAYAACWRLDSQKEKRNCTDCSWEPIEFETEEPYRLQAL